MAKKRKVIRNKNARQVAEALGLIPLTIQNWKGRGCPYSTKPMPNESEESTRITILYNIAEVKRWHKKNVKQGRPNEKN